MKEKIKEEKEVIELKEEKKSHEYSNLFELSSLGVNLVVTTFLGFGLGFYLDKKFGTRPALMIFFLILGIIAGFVNMFRIVGRYSRRKR